MDQSRGKRGNLLQAYRNVTLAEKLAFCAVVLFALATLIYCAGRGDLTNIVLCLLVIMAMLAPRFLEWLFQVQFSTFFKVFVMCYIACGAILGSVFEFYYLFCGLGHPAACHLRFPDGNGRLHGACCFKP